VATVTPVVAPTVAEVATPVDSGEPTPDPAGSATAVPAREPTPPPTPTIFDELDVPFDHFYLPPVIGLDAGRAVAVLEEAGLVAALSRGSRTSSLVVYSVWPPEGSVVKAGDRIALGMGESSDLLHGEIVEATVVQDWVVGVLDDGQTRTLVEVELSGGRTVGFLERRAPFRTVVVDVDDSAPLGCDGQPVPIGSVVEAATTVRFRFVIRPGPRAGVDESIGGVGISIVC
jgi:hypothetical protein